MRKLPAKLKHDAIAEAIFEIQFESSQMQEVALGRLADRPDWQNFENIRLPLADFPAVIRLQMPDMKFQPVMELRRRDTMRVVKIGPNVLSYHVLAPYPGWVESLETEFSQLVDHLLIRLEGCKVTRLGLRYINLLTESEHGISSISDLNYTFRVSKKPLDVPQMLSFERTHSDKHAAMVRIASPKFVQGPEVKPFSALVDIDVFTPVPVAMESSSEITSWLIDAHEIEKMEFFGLLTFETIDNLRAD
jgi:uncharacterized protein (TIGR04255 family)